MPDGRRQEPGGWNRIVLYVDSIDDTIAALTEPAARCRNKVEVGPGGKQILVDHPDGNPVELHEEPRKQGPRRKEETWFTRLRECGGEPGGGVGH
jgi:hypothetical protein